MQATTDVLGIPVPSTDPVFLRIVVVHIFISISCVLSGLVAMLSEKARGRHSLAGKVYFWSTVAAFVTVVLLSVMRWPHNIHLLIIGTLTVTFTWIGQRLAHTQRKNWRLHTMLMGFSYVLLLTGFYVDNGKNLPFWRMFPQTFFWIFPTVVGIPIIIYVLKKHPLNKGRA